MRPTGSLSNLPRSSLLYLVSPSSFIALVGPCCPAVSGSFDFFSLRVLHVPTLQSPLFFSRWRGASLQGRVVCTEFRHPPRGPRDGLPFPFAWCFLPPLLTGRTDWRSRTLSFDIFAVQSSSCKALNIFPCPFQPSPSPVSILYVVVRSQTHHHINTPPPTPFSECYYRLLVPPLLPLSV